MVSDDSLLRNLGRVKDFQNAMRFNSRTQRKRVNAQRLALLSSVDPGSSSNPAAFRQLRITTIVPITCARGSIHCSRPPVALRLLLILAFIFAPFAGFPHNALFHRADGVQHNVWTEVG